MRVTFNGRFLTAPQTGVQRVAGNLIAGVDQILMTEADQGGRSYDIQIPRGPQAPLGLSKIRKRNQSILTGQVWEQFEFPLSPGRGAIVNLSNAGPLLAESALTMVHDAQVFLTPSSYPKAFVAWYHFSLPRLASQARYLLTVSEYSKAQLIRFGVADAEKIIVIPNGVDHILRSAPDIGIRERLGLVAHRYVFAFGSLQSHKNLDLIVKLFGDPRLKNLTLIIVGAVDWTSLGRAFGATQQDNVLLTGRLTDGEIRGLLEEAACLVLPSSTEGFGLPPLEALLLGCPAVVAPLGALPEVCGTAALYAQLDDPDAWVEAILELVEDDESRLKRSLMAKAHARSFTWSRSATLLLAALDRALA